MLVDQTVLKKYNVMICQYDDTYKATEIKGDRPFYGWTFNPIHVDEMQIVAENGICKVKLLGESLPIVLDSIIFDLPLGLPLVKFDVLDSRLKIKKVAFFKYLTVLYTLSVYCSLFDICI